MATKRKAAKSGFKLGKRKVERTPAGTAVLYGQALVGNAQAREELRDAMTSARKAYRRSSDRRGRPDLAALLQDRKASKEAGNALTSLREALRVAGRKRRKPRSAKGPAVVIVAVAGTGAAAAVAKRRRDQAALEVDQAGQTPPVVGTA
jgi:hypothetical protein